MASKEQIFRRELLTVAMVVIALVFFYPVIFVLFNAFKTEARITLDPMGVPTSFFLGNYARAWKVMRFPSVFVNTLGITTFGVAGIVLASSMAAYALARNEWRLSWIIYGFFVFALVIPFQIIMVPIAVLAADLKLTSIPGIIPMYWGLGVPTAVFMFHGFVKGVPRRITSYNVCYTKLLRVPKRGRSRP